MIKFILPIIIFLILLVSPLSHTNALKKPTSGISVSPAILKLSIQPNQDTLPFTMQITNTYNYPVEVKLGTIDFTYLSSNGGLSFLKNETNLNPNYHGLATSIKSQVSSVELLPNQNQIILFSIVDATQLAIGGHYGAVTFSVSPKSVFKKNNVSIVQTVVSLVFTSSYGQGTQTTNLFTPIVGSLRFSMPTNLNLVITNNGNTQTVPLGVIQVYKGSKIISQAQLNTNDSFILPASNRLFNIDLPNLKSPLLPHSYKLVVQYKHVGVNKIKTYSQNFTVIPTFYIYLIIFVVIFLLWYFLKNKNKEK